MVKYVYFEVLCSTCMFKYLYGEVLSVKYLYGEVLSVKYLYGEVL